MTPMANLKDEATHRAALLYFDPRKIKVKSGLNGRDMDSPDTLAHIEWLAESIAENGLSAANPLEIFSEGTDIFVSSGHCRLAACMLAIERGAAIAAVPCVPETKGTSEIKRILNQSVFNGGLRLSPLEEGRNIQRAIALGAKAADIAKQLGKSLTYVTQAVEFQGAPEPVKDMVRKGEVSATLAADTLRRDPVRAEATLKAGVEKAKAAGKTKATAKHLPAATPFKKGPVANSLVNMLEKVATDIEAKADELAGAFYPDDVAAIAELARVRAKLEYWCSSIRVAVGLPARVRREPVEPTVEHHAV